MSITIRCDECNGDADSEQICRNCYEVIERERDDLAKEVDELKNTIMDLENTACEDCANYRCAAKES